MTETTKKTMTLEQVRDWHRKEAKSYRSASQSPYLLIAEKYASEHDACADAIDAHIAAQRDSDVATDCPFRAWWSMVEAQAEISGEAIPNEAIVLSFMGSAASTTVSAVDIRKMLTKPPHASMTVTDSDIGVALFAWCAKYGYSNIERMRAALEAVMKGESR